MHKNIYRIDIMNFEEDKLECLSVVDDSSFLCHKILGHVIFSMLNKLVPKKLIIGLLNRKVKT